MHEESAEEIEKNNEQTWKEVHEEEETRWQLSKESKREVDNIIWKSSYLQRWCCIINAKSLQEI
jgi:protein-arginine kinase